MDDSSQKERKTPNRKKKKICQHETASVALSNILTWRSGRAKGSKMKNHDATSKWLTYFCRFDRQTYSTYRQQNKKESWKKKHTHKKYGSRCFNVLFVLAVLLDLVTAGPAGFQLKSNGLQKSSSDFLFVFELLYYLDSRENATLNPANFYPASLSFKRYYLVTPVIAVAHMVARTLTVSNVVLQIELLMPFF